MLYVHSRIVDLTLGKDRVKKCFNKKQPVGISAVI